MHEDDERYASTLPSLSPRCLRRHHGQIDCSNPVNSASRAGGGSSNAQALIEQRLNDKRRQIAKLLRRLARQSE
jgi:hypothetical protein